MKKKDKGAGENTGLPLKPDQQVQELRSQAERVIHVLPPEDLEKLKPEERQKLLYELQVHQVELAMQNEELRASRVELEESRSRYFELYDLAPVGYLTLSEQGFITLANLTFATLLGVERSALDHKPLSRYILKEDQDIYYRHRNKLFESGEAQQCELRMVKADGVAFKAKLQGNLMQDEAGELQCRVVLSDITESKKAEEELRFQAKIIENTLTIAAYHDKDLNVLWMNRAYEKATGLSLEECRGRKCYQVWNLSKSCRGCPVITAIKTGEKANSELTPANQDHWPETQGCWLSEATPVRDEQGDVIGAIEFAINITERKAIEERLEQEQSEKELILNNMAEQVAYLDPELRIIWINAAVITRHNLEAVEHEGKKCYELYHGLEQPCPDCHALVAMETGETATGIHRSPDNSYWKMTCIPVRNQSGAIIGVMDTALEITDLITSRQKLQDNYSLLRLAGETARFGGWSVDLKTNIATWSDQVALIHEVPIGYSPPVEEGISFYAPEWREKISAVFTACAEEGIPYDEEMEIITAKGCRVWVRTAGEAVKDDQDNIVRVQGSFQDISERKKAEAALKQSEDRYDQAMSVKNEGVWEWDLITNDTYFDKRYYTMAGYQPGEFPCNFVAWAERVHEDDLPAARKAIDDYLKGDSNEFNIEFRFRKKDDQWMWVNGKGKISQRDENSKPLRMIGTHTDITDRKLAEEEVYKLNAELEQRVKDRTIELEAVNKELESFSYSISHDFRAPLRALNAFSASLTEKYSDQLDEQGLHYLNRINKASLYMSDLVDDLLKLSRITRADMNRQKVDISQTAEEIIQDLQIAEPERQVKVAVAQGLSAKGDTTLLKDALVNLIGNAWKFSSKEEQAEIEVGWMTIAGEKVFFVRDNGVGFNMAYAKNLFGAFQRLHGVDEFPGTGIGLATVQRIINRHGGRIWAESEVGKGATFYFTLQL